MCKLATFGVVQCGRYLVVAISLLLVLCGCGGGTEGTGGRRTLYGTVLSDFGEPLSGVGVSVAGSPEISITDSRGNFNLVSDATVPQATLSVRFESELFVLDSVSIPEGVALVIFKIRINTSESTTNAPGNGERAVIVETEFF